MSAKSRPWASSLQVDSAHFWRFEPNWKTLLDEATFIWVANSILLTKVEWFSIESKEVQKCRYICNQNWYQLHGAGSDTTNQWTFDFLHLLWIYWKTLCLFSLWLLRANANKNIFGVLWIWPCLRWNWIEIALLFVL